MYYVHIWFYCYMYYMYVVFVSGGGQRYRVCQTGRIYHGPSVIQPRLQVKHTTKTGKIFNR